MNKFNKQSGRSMVEMLGVLAIVAVLSVGGIAGYSKAMSKYKISKSLNQIQTIVVNIKTLYETQKNYVGLTTDNVKKYNVFPNEMIVGNNVQNTFGGEVTVWFWHAMGNYLGFEINFNNLPKNACIQLATADWGNSASSGFVGLHILGSYQTSNSALMPENRWSNNKLPVTIESAAQQCSSEANNSIKWIYI